jgi:hypothetical protein
MRNKIRFFITLIVFIALNMSNTSCNKDDAMPTLEAASIELVSGNNQTAEFSSSLINPIVILVKDQNGIAFKGAEVNFTVSEGSVSNSTVFTDSLGIANVIWTIGETIGNQTLNITAFTVNGKTALSGSPLIVNATALLEIGSYYAGGIVFYIDQTGKHGLVCTLSDQSSAAEWGCYGTSLDGADGTSIGTGGQNTLDIVSGCYTVGTAAHLCYNLNFNGFDDWFLPSLDELSFMYHNKNAINEVALTNGGEALFEDYYWSSSEYSSWQAWPFIFTDGNSGTIEKNIKARVRAVRAF